MSNEVPSPTASVPVIRPDEMLSLACTPPEGLSLMLRNQYEQGFRDACQKAYGVLLARMGSVQQAAAEAGAAPSPEVLAMFENISQSQEFTVANALADYASVLPAYEAQFQKEITELVMRHIDRMNDICEQDPAERIIQSFVSGFDPLFDVYMDAKFPGREAMLRRPKDVSATQS